MNDQSRFRVVMLTNGGLFGLRVLLELRSRGVTLPAVILESAPTLRARLFGTTPPRSPRQFAGRILSWFHDRKVARSRRKLYAAETPRLVMTGALNSEHMQRDLNLLQPDFIILGGMGVLAESILGLPRHGVINCHPGLLPWVRGTGVVGRAIARAIPIGCTCHYVDKGIDTGIIIERRLLPVTGTESSLSQLEERANALAATTLAETVAGLVMQGVVPQAVQQRARLPLSSWLSPAERDAVEGQVREGRARELFESWRAFCLEDDGYRLPASFGLDGQPEP